MGHPDAEPKLMGKQINVMVTPYPANKRKRKYTLHADEVAIDDAGKDDHDQDDDHDEGHK